jgi:Fur family ferric uptake transcriptional regulator
MTLIDQLLAVAGNRPTQTRIAICSAIENSTDHPDAEIITARSGVSIATVYRTLDVLTEIGAIRAFDFFGDGRNRYEVNSGDFHGHTISKSTGVVDDIDIAPYIAIASETVLNGQEMKLLIVTD